MFFLKNGCQKVTMLAVFAPLLLCLPLVGCGGSSSQTTQEKTPEEIEESRQEHIDMSERERSEG